MQCLSWFSRRKPSSPLDVVLKLSIRIPSEKYSGFHIVIIVVVVVWAYHAIVVLKLSEEVNDAIMHEVQVSRKPFECAEQVSGSFFVT